MNRLTDYHVIEKDGTTTPFLIWRLKQMPDPIPIGGLHPYPAAMPSDLIDRAIALISGQPIEVEDAHRLWHVAGYILSKFDAHAPKGAAKAASAAEAVAVLESLKDDGTMKAFDWSKLKPVALLLIDLLANWLKS